MIKIGIVTWFADYNYGTKLQAYALQEYLNRKGYDAFIINYTVPTKGCKEPNRSVYKKIYGKLSWELLKIIKKIYRKEIELRNSKMERFTTDRCRLTSIISDDKEFSNICNLFDVIVTGSDQIWNPNWYNKVFYADFPNISAIRIAYAPSLGTNSIAENVREKIRSSLNGFYKIGIREKTGQQLLLKLFGIQSTKVVDPTLLLDKDSWIELMDTDTEDLNKPYVFCYMLSDNPNHWRAIRKYVKERGLQLRVIPKEGFSYTVGTVKEYSAGIERFLSLIYYSDCVITDSFHACVFSVLFNKKFIPIERFSSSSDSSQNTRIYDFLASLNISDILETYDTKEIKEHNIDWKQTRNLLECQIIESKRFLSEALNKGKNND